MNNQWWAHQARAIEGAYHQNQETKLQQELQEEREKNAALRDQVFNLLETIAKAEAKP
jgi:predicted  nucleic acid-binding Zn-ribbon protein